MSIIIINNVSFDPSTQHNLLSTAAFQIADAASSDYILIQTLAPLTVEQREELSSKGVYILEYVPADTYLCNYKGTDLTAIRALPYVQWANVYMEEFKMSPALKFGLGTKNTRTLAEMAVRPVSQTSRSPRTVDLVFHKGVQGEEIRERIAQAAHLDAEDFEISSSKVRLTVQAGYLPALAAIDEVRHIEEVTPYRLWNNIARKVLNADVILSGTAFEGEGQIVTVADTGFDKGSVTDVHPAFAGRVIKLYSLGRTGKANDPDGHGTHVSGSVLGKGTSATLGVDVTGTAPKAKLILQSVLDNSGGLGGLPADLHNLFKTPYQKDGARIHTNSWGGAGDGQYNSNCTEVDDFVWNNRDMVICFAAGNEGRDGSGTGHIDGGSVSSPGTAKNCITVGASENNRPSFTLTYGQGWPNDFPAAPISVDKVADNTEGMVGFSSRGPTADHRIKPDVVAPGTYILSTLSRSVKSKNPGWGASGDPLYFYDGGTSMATPLVAGCVAVVREYLVKVQQIARPSAALVKAMLINGAYGIHGQYNPTETGPFPNNAEGFGRVNLATTIGPFSPGQLFILKNEHTELDANQEESIMVNIPANARSLKVTLVWTDPAGEKLQNDLDLIVKAANGQEAHGNVGLGSADFDRDNNVEQVLWPQIPAGDCKITVRAYRITQAKQSFALVIRTEM